MVGLDNLLGVPGMLSREISPIGLIRLTKAGTGHWR